MRDADGSSRKIPESAGRRLRRVVPIAHTVLRGGVALTLFRLDDFDDGFVFRCWLVLSGNHPIREQSVERRREEQAYAQAFLAERSRHGAPRSIAPMVWQDGPRPQMRDGHWPNLAWSIADDRRNRYSVHGFGGGEQGPGEFHLDASCEPVLDPDAKRLTIEAARVDWSSMPPREKRQQSVHSDAGPWLFPVDLSAERSVVASGDLG